MKKYFFPVIFMLIISLLASCVQDSNNNDSSSKPDINIENREDYKRIFEFTSQTLFFSEKEEFEKYNFKEVRDAWIDLIRTKYDFEVDVTDLFGVRIALGVGGFSLINYENIKKHINEGKINGLVNLGARAYVNSLADDKLILPLDMYLKDNKTWKSFPEDFKDSFKFNGYVWAIPTRKEYRYSHKRHIRGDWLENLKINVPGTVDEFYEVLKAFTYDDPDKDGDHNTIGAEYSRHGGLADIFAAFDARLSYDGKFPVAWNPNSNLWEDSMLKTEMKECFQFLSTCQKEGLIKDSFELKKNPDICFLEGYSGSTLIPIILNILYKEKIYKNPDFAEPRVDIIPPLTHNISKNIMGYYVEQVDPYVLTVNSKAPQATIDFFLDTILGDEKGFILAKYGLESLSYDYVPEEKYFKLKSVEVNFRGNRTCFKSPMLVYDSPILDINYDEYKYEKDKIRFDIEKSIMASDLTYEIPFEIMNINNDRDTHKNIKRVKEYFCRLKLEIIKGAVSFEDGLARYKGFANTYGMQKYIEEQNQKLGK